MNERKDEPVHSIATSFVDTRVFGNSRTLESRPRGPEKPSSGSFIHHSLNHPGKNIARVPFKPDSRINISESAVYDAKAPL